MPAFQVQLIIPAMSHSAATRHEGLPPYWQRPRKLPRDGVERVGSSKLKASVMIIMMMMMGKLLPRAGAECLGSSTLKAYVIIMMMMGKFPRDGVERMGSSKLKAYIIIIIIRRIVGS